MMKRFLTAFMVLTMTLCIGGLAQAEMRDYWANVYSWDGQISEDGKPTLTREDTYVQFKVLQAGSNTAETLYEYNDDSYTSLTNPVTATNFTDATVCNDRVQFRCDPAETNDLYVDLIVVDTTGGYSYFFEDFSVNDHTIVIDERMGVIHQGVVWYDGVSGTATSTGVVFDPGMHILGVQVEVVDNTAAGLISCGADGVAAGFLTGVATTVEGYVLESIGTSGASLDSTDFYMNGATITAAADGTFKHTCSNGAGNGYLHYRFVRTR